MVNGFRSYVDFEFNRSRRISRIPIALDDSSSDDENRTPQPKAVQEKRPVEQPSASTDPPESDSATPQKLHQCLSVSMGIYPVGSLAPFLSLNMNLILTF